MIYPKIPPPEAKPAGRRLARPGIKRNVVVTGFGLFRDIKSNPSWEAIKDGALGIDEPDINVITKQLSVSYGQVDEVVPKLWRQYNPVLMVHVGLSAKEASITIERGAREGPYLYEDVANRAPHAHLKACLEAASTASTTPTSLTLTPTPTQTPAPAPAEEPPGAGASASGTQAAAAAAAAPPTTSSSTGGAPAPARPHPSAAGRPAEGRRSKSPYQQELSPPSMFPRLEGARVAGKSRPGKKGPAADEEEQLLLLSQVTLSASQKSEPKPPEASPVPGSLGHLEMLAAQTRDPKFKKKAKAMAKSIAKMKKKEKRKMEKEIEYVWDTDPIFSSDQQVTDIEILTISTSPEPSPKKGEPKAGSSGEREREGELNFAYTEPPTFACRSTCLNVDRVVDKMNQAFQRGHIPLPCQASTDAGLYLCEYIYQTSLKLSDRSIFIHVPSSERFALEDIRIALKYAIELLIEEVRALAP